MANGLTMTKEDMDKYFQELAKKSGKSVKVEPKISLGRGPEFTSTGTRTASQDIARFYKELDPSELTPFQKSQMGGEEEIAKNKKAANQLLASETPSKKPLSITGEKKAEAKATPKSATKTKDKEPPPPDIYRVMVKGGDPTKDKFYNTKKEADDALEAMGGKGAVAGVRFPAETSEKKSQLMEQYKRKARGEVAPKGVDVEAEARKARYQETLAKGREKAAEREAASKERAAKFRSDIAAKEASNEQLSQYNQQLSTLKRAYRDARRAGDYVEQYRLGDFINSYQAGIPKEMGARQKAARTGIIAQRNKELAEQMRREREARIAAERTSMANPDFQQFNANQFGQGLTYSKL